MPHTPGPWLTDYHDEDGVIVVVSETTGVPIDVVAKVKAGKAHSDSDAALIAAAPDLLAALKRAVWALDDCDTFGDCLLDDHLKALAEAKAAIAAAEGQQ